MEIYNANAMPWRRVHACESNTCVEIAAMANSPVFVRSSERPGEITVLTREEWRDFVVAVKKGEFDDL